MPKDTKTLGNNKARACESLGFVHKKRLCQRFDTTSFLLCNRLFIGLSFPLHSLSSLSNPSYGNLVLSKSSQFKHAGYGDTRFC